MEIIEQIGSYAGLASVVGLAVLAALYFSQARDVKRLREWAGRAPERGAMPAAYQRPVAPPRPVAPQRVPSPAAAVAQGTARPGGGPARPGAPAQGPVAPGTIPPRPPMSPGGAPAPAPVRAAAPGAAPPATTGPPTATPAAARVAAEEDRGEGAADRREDIPQDTMLHPPPSAPREAEPEEDEPDAEEAGALDADELGEELRSEDDELYAGDDEYEDELDQGEDVQDVETGDSPAVPQAAPPPPIPSRPPPPMPARAAPPRQPPILPPYEQSKPGADQPWYHVGLASRGGVLGIGATLFVVALVVVGLLQLGGEDSPEPTRQQAAPSVGAGGGASPNRAGVVPGRVTVSVLNGTTVGGLARELGDKLQAQGFRLGNVTNSSDQARAESVVLFAPGAEREGAEVGRRLKIDQREPIDPESQTLAGDATVVVIAGGDLK